MKKNILILIVLTLFLLKNTYSQAIQSLNWKKVNVLVYTKNRKGYVHDNIPDIHPTLVQDVKSLNPADEKERENIKLNKGSFVDYYPAAWSHFYDGGVCWITTLGHDKKDYKDPIYVKHLFQGIRFVAQNVAELDYSKVYATERDSGIK